MGSRRAAIGGALVTLRPRLACGRTLPDAAGCRSAPPTGGAARPLKPWTGAAAASGAQVRQ
ncbi:hypothetical protein [Amycolatopsis sp. WAC 04197]|uniref:hypothetical protein n=1 Tax=Amycolatopsis sp. WAC 04197 TaxID=2203199 RepID=UPI000F796C13|nr:hypothetical protein [Amycolatopsis sp. WAC 04197]